MGLLISMGGLIFGYDTGESKGPHAAQVLVHGSTSSPRPDLGIPGHGGLPTTLWAAS